MKTTIQMIPSASSRLQTPVELSSEWASFTNVETDTAYSFVAVAGSNRTYRGSMKVIAEESANNAGTRRLLLKIELPLSAQANSATQDGCCCQTAPDEVPMVSVHTVITVPKSVAVALTKGENAATDQLSVAIRLLQSLLAGVCHQPADFGEDLQDGDVVSEGAVIVANGSIADASANLMGGDAVMPIRRDSSTGAFHLDVGVPDNAPIWGLIGGLKRLS